VPPEQTVPHMGWNRVELPEDMDLFAGLGPAKHFYFAHSYYAQVTDGQARTALVDYGSPLTASVQKGNIYGVQFHPEKSSNQGLQVLKNFYALCVKREA
ncbi:MAG: imidazole glycerol phosphate synthase subunit HisH, partial [Phycisphaerae bacterium]|nr:imidazole glycerol phosphate synthase subunit HisH [Phycisphaerae bacterium]